jgi:transcriptional regulator with XRE-family HTH domain
MATSFAKKLKELREACGLSGLALSKQAEISQPLLNRIENGQREPTPEVIAKLAPVLGVSVEEMQAWADADELGETRLRGLRQFGLLSGGLDVPDDIEDEPDDWEREVLIRTGAATAHDYSSQSDFWYLPKHERRAILENLDEIWRENEALMKKMRKRG